MTREAMNFVPPPPQVAELAHEAPRGLVSHMRRLELGQSALPWLSLAALTGAAVAFAFIRFLSR